MGTNVQHAAAEASFTGVPALTAYMGDDMAIYGAAYYLPNGIGHVQVSTTPHPRTSCNLGTDG